MWAFPTANATRKPSTQPRARQDTLSPRGLLHGSSPCVLDEYRRRDNWNSAEGVQREQIGITAHDQIRMATDSQLQKLIIGRVATSRDVLDDGNQLGDGN